MTDNLSAHLEVARGLVLLVGPTLQPPSRKSFHTAGESGVERRNIEQPRVLGQKFRFRFLPHRQHSTRRTENSQERVRNSNRGQ